MSLPPLPDVTVPDASSRFNVPAGAGFVAWFAALRASINVLSVEILNRAKAAAEAAAAAGLADPSFVRGQSRTSQSDIAWSFTDEDGRRSWLEIAADGGPTTHAMSFLLRLLRSPEVSPSGDIAWSFTDEDGRRSWLEIGRNGGPTSHTVALLNAAGVGSGPGTVSEASLSPALADRIPMPRTFTDSRTLANRGLMVRAPDGSIRRAVSDPAIIACWGDSMTEGWPYASVDPATQSWPAVLDQIYTNGTTYNGGKSGQSADEIALRQGGMILQVAITGGSIPASGSVAATVPDQVIGWRLDRGWADLVTIAGVEGTLTRTTGTANFTFARTASGSAVPVAGVVPAYSVRGDLYADNVSIIFAGRNDIGYTSAAGGWSDRVIAATVAMVNRLSPLNPRFLLVGVMTTTGETKGTAGYTDVLAVNEALRKLYPSNFYDLRAYLVKQCIYDLGITPTADDLAKIAGDTLPPSIMVPGDGTHYSAATAAKVAQRFHEQLTTRGWLL